MVFKFHKKTHHTEIIGSEKALKSFAPPLEIKLENYAPKLLNSKHLKQTDRTSHLKQDRLKELQTLAESEHSQHSPQNNKKNLKVILQKKKNILQFWQPI